MSLPLITFLTVSDLSLARKVCTSLSSMFGSRATFRIASFPNSRVEITGEIHDLSNEDLEGLIWFNAGFYYCAHLNSLI